MSQHNFYNRPREAQFYRDNSLPTYEEAIANVHHSVYTTTRFGNVNNFDGQTAYDYAQAARAQLADVSSRRQNVDICIQDQPRPSVVRITQTVAEERELAERRDERRTTENWIVAVVFIILLLIIPIIIFIFLQK